MTINYKICPKCNSKDISKIIYGYPSHELYMKEEKGEIKLGGCCISLDSPEYFCNQCKNEWRKEDVIIKECKMIKKINASVGGYFGTSYDVKIDLEKKKVIWESIERSNYDRVESNKVTKSLEEADVMYILNRLRLTDILNWKKSYTPNEPILDGTSWGIDIEKRGKTIHKSGSNAFPDEWSMFCNLIQEITEHPFS